MNSGGVLPGLGGVVVKYSNRIVPAGLIFLSLVPLIAGIVRVLSIVNGSDVSIDNARFRSVPLPIVIHIAASLTFCILGAFQFNSAFRSARPRWHIVSGRLLIVCGLCAAVSGIWMTQFYPMPPGAQHPLLYLFRMAIGFAMTGYIGLSLIFILKRNILQHRNWMIRAYAIGQGAGTQALLFIPIMVLGDLGSLGTALVMISGWVVNIVVAERYAVR